MLRGLRDVDIEYYAEPFLLESAYSSELSKGIAYGRGSHESFG